MKPWPPIPFERLSILFEGVTIWDADDEDDGPMYPVPMLTDDPTDPRLSHGQDRDVDQAEVYLVLSDAERAKGFVRPVRRKYLHETCGTVTTMGQALAETYARQPDFYSATYCVACRGHFPVGPDGEFLWDGTDIRVGS